MIDIEKYVFNAVYPDVSAVVPKDCFKSEYVPVIAKLPFATLWELDNFTDRRRRTNAAQEDFSVLTFEANSYASTKPQCREVMAALCNAMNRIGFERISMQFTPNQMDSQIFRIVARFQAEVDQNQVIYRYR